MDVFCKNKQTQALHQQSPLAYSGFQTSTCADGPHPHRDEPWLKVQSCSLQVLLLLQFIQSRTGGTGLPCRSPGHQAAPSSAKSTAWAQTPNSALQLEHFHGIIKVQIDQ